MPIYLIYLFDFMIILKILVDMGYKWIKLTIILIYVLSLKILELLGYYLYLVLKSILNYLFNYFYYLISFIYYQNLK